MKKPFLNKLNHAAIVLIFCAAVFIPFFLGVGERDKTTSAIEKRELAVLPKTPRGIREIKKYPAKFEAYYADHFGLRDGLNAYYKLAKYHIGDSPSPDVTIGKNGWLFLGSIKKGYTKYHDPMGDFRGTNLYSQTQLNEYVQYITGLRAWLKDRGVEYIFIIAPNKHTIYYDQLPDYISNAKIDSATATDQLVSYLKEKTDITIIDPRTLLRNEKTNYQLYFKADTHWNAYAANIVQYKVFTEIEKLFPGMIEPELFEIKTTGKRGGDLANFIGISISKEPNPQPLFNQSCQPIKSPSEAKGRETHTFTCENQKLNAVIFRDSFFTALQPFFARKFYRSTYVWERVNYPSLIKYIESESPDIIIEEWVERTLPFVPRSPQPSIKTPYKGNFDNSLNLIFANEWDNLIFSSQVRRVDTNNPSLKLVSMGKDPIVLFPLLSLEPQAKYMLHVIITSSVTSNLQLFFSDAGNKGSTFAQNRSIRKHIEKGENEVYLLLDYPNLGPYLRIDPISTKGEVSIHSLVIKKI